MKPEPGRAPSVTTAHIQTGWVTLCTVLQRKGTASLSEEEVVQTLRASFAAHLSPEQLAPALRAAAVAAGNPHIRKVSARMPS